MREYGWKNGNFEGRFIRLRQSRFGASRSRSVAGPMELFGLRSPVDTNAFRSPGASSFVRRQPLSDFNLGFNSPTSMNQQPRTDKLTRIENLKATIRRASEYLEHRPLQIEEWANQKLLLGEHLTKLAEEQQELKSNISRRNGGYTNTNANRRKATALEQLEWKRKEYSKLLSEAEDKWEGFAGESVPRKRSELASLKRELRQLESEVQGPKLTTKPVKAWGRGWVPWRS